MLGIRLMTIVFITFTLHYYSGEFSGVGVQIEDLTGKVWDNCFHPLLNKVR